MKQLWTDVKSFVTIVFTVILAILVIVPVVKGQDVPDAIIALFSADLGMIMTYFFTKKKDAAPIESNDEEADE